MIRVFIGVLLLTAGGCASTARVFVENKSAEVIVVRALAGPNPGTMGGRVSHRVNVQPKSEGTVEVELTRWPLPAIIREVTVALQFPFVDGMAKELEVTVPSGSPFRFRLSGTVETPVLERVTDSGVASRLKPEIRMAHPPLQPSRSSSPTG